jgi:hypothetical protein
MTLIIGHLQIKKPAIISITGSSGEKSNNILFFFVTIRLITNNLLN